MRTPNISHFTKNISGGNKTDGLRMGLRPTSCRRRRPFAGISSNQWSRECSNLRKNVLSGSVWSLRRTWINDRGTVKAYNWFLFEQDFQKSQPSKEIAQVWTIETKTAWWTLHKSTLVQGVGTCKTRTNQPSEPSTIDELVILVWSLSLVLS